jgi:very-short-patch-repair endonuclease
MPDGYSRKKRLTETQAERKLAEALGMLKSIGLTFRRQAPKGSHVVNFTSDEAGLVIELDTNQVPDERQAKYNAMRIDVLAQRGFRFLRFWTQDVDRNLAQVMAQVMAVLRDQHESQRAKKAAAASGGAPDDQSGDDGLPRPKRRNAG